MQDFISVVTEQKMYICAVHSFIVKLIRAVLPEVAWDSTFLHSEGDLGAALDAVIAKHANAGANEGDCRLEMAQTACRKMKRVCDLLKVACASVGLQDVAGQYLDSLWFVSVLLRMDKARLAELCQTVNLNDEKPSRMLMNVAAALNGDAVRYDSMNARSKRKADSETKALIEKVGERVEALHVKIDGGKREIVGKIDAVHDELRKAREELLAKADAILERSGKAKIAGKRNSRHTTEQKKVCMACWMQAQENETLKSGTATGKPTHEAAFLYYKRQLALVDVTTLEKFKAVIHTVNNINSAESIKRLEAKREAERKAKKGKKPQPRRR